MWLLENAGKIWGIIHQNSAEFVFKIAWIEHHPIKKFNLTSNIRMCQLMWLKIAWQLSKSKQQPWGQWTQNRWTYYDRENAFQLDGNFFQTSRWVHGSP